MCRSLRFGGQIACDLYTVFDRRMRLVFESDSMIALPINAIGVARASQR